MPEKKEWRVCLNCLEEKRTTVRKEEEEKYYCEQCLKRIARTALKQSSPKKGLNILIWTIVISVIIGYLIGKYLF